MTQYKTLNIDLFNLQFNKLKSGIKNGTEVILKLSSNVAGDSNDKNNFPHKLLLNNTQVSKFRKAFANKSFLNHFRIISKNSIAFNEKCIETIS